MGRSEFASCCNDFQRFNCNPFSVTDLADEQRRILSLTISQHCKRVASDVIYTGDGLFIVRLRAFEECHEVELRLKLGDRHVRGSPMCLKQLIPEHCRCPRPIDEFMRSMKCPSFIRQIYQDLKPFTKLDFRIIKDQVQKRFQNFRSSSLCNYVVKDNEVHRKCHGQYTGFSMFMDATLLSITNKVRLPDLEFFINLGDWPLIRKSSSSIPIFSWCGSIETMDIVLPTYDLTESTLNMLHRVTLDMLSVQKERWKWEDKVEKAFFRGRDSRRERLDLIDVSRQHPGLFNSSITNFFFFTNEIAKYGPKVGHISFNDFFEFKYQINMDGTVAAYRMPYLLAGNSLVLKQDSPYYEHYYHDLRPFEHYVPFHRDVKLDLVEKVKWLKANDHEAKRIMRNARNFARNNLMPSNIFCYHLLLLKVNLCSWTKLFNWQTFFSELLARNRESHRSRWWHGEGGSKVSPKVQLQRNQLGSCRQVDFFAPTQPI